ncbi:ABC-type phosphate/phosphonate transport system substrate-binding protein [Sphingomonas zeicaulis]|uniref:phosphate/phosphite/phosphonate ABC transporter substrate-binding protein n=1 Tax=Sphingomonas zeicaulis TaxID=1632740 RepID=UPI003D1F7CDC
MRSASLGMYDPPWLHAANDRLWALIAARLADAGIADVPTTLDRATDLDDLWRSPALLLAQTCGYPLMTELRETVQIVATPRYRVPGAEGAWHRAAIVVRAGDPANRLSDLRGRRAGVNGLNSNTGMNLFRAALAPFAREGRFFDTVCLTGGHAASIEALVAGTIDVAAIDAVTLELLSRHDPGIAPAIRILAWTAAVPGLPLVTAAATPPETVATMRRVLQQLVTDPAFAPAAATLALEGFETLSLESYGRIVAIETMARTMGYPHLA